MRIQHNIAALNSYRQLGTNNSNVSKNLEKLSSGYKINRAGDDAAGLSISEKMRSQITGLETAQKNSQDGISLIQTAEGNLQEVHSMMNRMVELATQSSNGTYSDFNRKQLQKEIDSLNSEVDRIASSANFNGLKLLDGTMGGGGTGFSKTTSGSELTFKAADGMTLTIATGAASAVAKASITGKDVTLTLAKTKTYSADDINKLLKAAGVDATVELDKDITVDSAMAKTTATGPKNAKITVGGIDFESVKAGNNTSNIAVATAAGVEGVTVDNSTGDIVLSLDSNKTYTADDINKLLSNAGAGAKAVKVGTIAADTTGDALAGGAGIGSDGLTLQVGDTNESYQKVTVSVGNMDSKSLGLAGIDISSQSGAQAAIDSINAAIDSVSSTRGDLGALQNRLDHTISNIGVAVENMTAAESRIRDTDMAQEMMDFTKNNILTQAAQAMLAQANTIPQSVLQLLQ